MILTFHGIGTVQRPLDPGEDEVWLRSEEFAPVLDAAARDADRVRLTFDDGNASDVEIALPELRARGMRATFFVVAGKLGEHGYLDEGGVRALADAGMGIGCHGMRHRPWRHLTDADLREELVDARRLIESVVGRPVHEAACPFGSYDRRVLGSLRAAGYKRVFTSDRGWARPGAWLQARNTLRTDAATAAVGQLLAQRTALHVALPRQARLTVKRLR